MAMLSWRPQPSCRAPACLWVGHKMSAAFVAPWQHPVCPAPMMCRSEGLHLNAVHAAELLRLIVKSHPAVPPGPSVLNIGCVEHFLNVSQHLKGAWHNRLMTCYELELHNVV